MDKYWSWATFVTVTVALFLFFMLKDMIFPQAIYSVTDGKASETPSFVIGMKKKK